MNKIFKIIAIPLIFTCSPTSPISHKPYNESELIMHLEILNTFFGPDTLFAKCDSITTDTNCYKTYIYPDRPILQMPYFASAIKDTIILMCRIKNNTDSLLLYIEDDKGNIRKIITDKPYPYSYNISFYWGKSLDDGTRLIDGNIYGVIANFGNKYHMEYWFRNQ